MNWSLDDVRIVGDIVVGSLLANALRLVVLKAFLEPAAAFIGRYAYGGLRQERTEQWEAPQAPSAVERASVSAEG